MRTCPRWGRTRPRQRSGRGGRGRSVSAGRARRGGGRAEPASAVPDVLGPGLRVVFCGINPGFVSAAAAAHFANPRNDFWRLLADAGITSRLFEPAEQFEAARARRRADERRRADDAGLERPPPRGLRGRGRAARADRAASCARARSPSSARRPTAGPSASAPSSGPQDARSATPGCSSSRRRRPRTPPCPGTERLRWFRELRDWLEPVDRPAGAGARARRGTTGPAGPAS